MSCGCSKDKQAPEMATVPESFLEGATPSEPTDNPASADKSAPATPARQATARNWPAAIIAKTPSEQDARSGLSDYDGSLGCRKCYAKHLSKAVVELAEFIEDNRRYEELSLCMGDLACAEDHAGALGLDNEKARIREMRAQIWDANTAVIGGLRTMASRATMSAMVEGVKNRAMASRPPAKQVSDKAK